VELYAVRLDPGGDHGEGMAALDAIALAPDLFLVRSDLTQSRLYHLVKRETGSASLFVGRLAERPKFKGMAAGSLAALRDWEPPQD
jgi:non-ribosomal peptide synthetase component F